jgi:hypothetical protein
MGVEALAEALKTNRALQGLSLFANRIGVHGARAIARVLSTNGFNGTSDEGATAVAEDRT